MGNIKFLLLVFFLIAIVANGCWEEERNALLDLQANIMSSNGDLLVDWAGYNANGFIDCCFWKSIKCSLETSRVIKLDLGSERFGSGDDWRFNASLSSIQVTASSFIVLQKYYGNLEKLNLNDNNFNFSIFSSLKIFPSLKHLNLVANEINGSIKMNDIIDLSNLEHLDLRGNNIESFVTTKGNKRMSSLRNLLLGSSYSNSSRVIQSLKSFSSLKSLFYEYSDLTSPTIIYTLRNLSTVEYLYLEGCSLNDNFLSNIGQMTSLKVLSMPFGDNNGTLPYQGRESACGLEDNV